MHFKQDIGQTLARINGQKVREKSGQLYQKNGLSPCRAISAGILPLNLAQISSIYRLTVSFIAIWGGLQWFVSIAGLILLYMGQLQESCTAGCFQNRFFKVLLRPKMSWILLVYTFGCMKNQGAPLQLPYSFCQK